MYGGNDKLCGIGFKMFCCRMGSRCGSRTTKSVSKIRFHIDNQRSNMEGFPGSSAVKNLPANAGVAGSVPVSGRSPGEGMATHSRILAWRIPWTEEPGGLQSIRSYRVGHD